MMLTEEDIKKATKALYKSKWDKQHREERREANRQWKRANRDKVRASKRKWRQGNSGEKRRAYNLKALYGVTPEWFDAKLQEQGGGCAICGDKDKGRKIRSLHVDHCHQTMVNRGILCELCNHAIARIESVPNWTDKALAYLQKYKLST
jgi:Recombination endonuclease VII